MLKNYIKIALRTIWRDRAFSIINLIGLAVGLASVIMIMAYVRYELSYDRSYNTSPYVYRVSLINRQNGIDQEQIMAPSGLTPALKKEFPSINSYSIVVKRSVPFKYRAENVKLDAIDATADFFKVFNFKFIEGDAANALKEPNSIVITENTAQKYFPGADAMGKTIAGKDSKGPLKITGIIENIPANTHFQAEAILSLEGDRVTQQALDFRAYTGLPQYILLNKYSDAAELENQFKTIYKKYNFPKTLSLKLLPVTAIHLYSHTENEFMPNGDIKYIYIFSSVALLILLIACINYINLTTARSIQRGREIGVRKVLGAIKKQLIVQFLSESFLFFAICLILGVLLAAICWPQLTVLISPGRHIPLFDAWSIILISLIVLVVGLISGTYPAFIMSKVKTAQVLKGVTSFGVNISLRKLLVAVQFVISGVLIVSAIVIYQQLNFINNARLGFNKEHLITTPFVNFTNHVSVFKNELKTNSNIKAVTVSTWETGIDYGENAIIPDDKDSTKTLKIQFISADLDFVKTMGINITRGRNFSADNGSDLFNVDSAMSKFSYKDPAYKKLAALQSYIINEEAIKALKLNYKDNLVLSKGIQGTIVGVVQNFNGLTLHEKISPVAIRCKPGIEWGHLYVRISPGNTQQSIAFIQKKWSQFYPDQPFEFSFVDDKLQQLYSSDKKVGQLFDIFAALAIAIACLGLFGLISLTVQQRVKEIGIRKVLGASTINITALLSTDFLKLIIVSMLIASPISWYVMNKWLQDFAYRVAIAWWIFAVAIMFALLIAFITVSFQSIKAAMTNPVKSLRSE